MSQAEISVVNYVKRYKRKQMNRVTYLHLTYPATSTPQPARAWFGTDVGEIDAPVESLHLNTTFALITIS